MSRGRGRASPSRPDTPRGRGRGRGRGTGIRRSASVGSVKGEQLSEDGDRDGQQQQAGSDGDEAGNSNDENEDRSNDDEEDSQEDEESSEDSGEDEKDPDAMNYRDDAEDSPRKKKGKQAKHQGKGGRPGRPAKQGGNAAAGGKRRGRPPANDKGKDRERDREQARQGDNAGNAAAAAAAAASGSGSAAAGGAAPSTDLHALDDAVGMAGVDLNAEEEAIRASNYGPRGQQARDGQGNNTNNQQGNTSSRNRQKVRPQIIVDEQAIKDAVLRIAAQYQLRNLESDSLPLIGLAVQMRIRTLLEAMIEAKQHRVSGHHMRPPPMHPARYEGDLPAPMWDTVMYDDVDKIVSTFDRLEREEERQARKDRLARDQAEQEERERLERLAREAAENGEEFIMPPVGAAAAAAGAGGLGDVSMGDSTTGTPGPGGAGSSIPGTPLSASIGPGSILDLKGKGRDIGTGTGNAKEKKRKRETPAQQARNMSDDVRKRLSDQTAQRKLGGKKFSWLSGGSGPGSSSDSPLGKKARPKFPPLPPSNLSISTSFPGTPGLDGLIPGGVKTDGDTPLPTPGPGALGRLTSIPNIHEASRSTEDPANKVITIRDALFVMEHERGMGAGVGSGTKSMTRAYMGRT